MLDELRIRRLGVIDDAVLPLGAGLTVVTGETGAGKTMVVTGLLLLFGGRADAARVRTGADQATVDGRLTVPADSVAARRVRAAGGALDDVVPSDPGDGAAPVAGRADAELVLRRVVNASGRSRAHVGGAAAPVAVLGELADSLLAVHGQSDQLRLARPAAQRAALDRFGAIALGDYRAAYDAWQAAAAALVDRVGRAAQLRREADLLARGIAEIEAVSPQPDEADELARAAARLGHADALTAVARLAHDTLVGSADDAVSSGADVTALVATAARATDQQRGADPELDALTARLQEIAMLAADLGADFGSYADGLDSDPAQLERIERRRADVGALVRKYCDEPEPSVTAVLSWAAAARLRLGDIDVSDEAIALLRKAHEHARDEASRAAADVSARRRAAAQRLGGAVTTELHGLAMPDSRLSIEVTPRTPTAGGPNLAPDGVEAGAGPEGCDDVAFLLRAHPGAPALALGRGASGGELSRVMLAVEVSLVSAGDGTAGGTVSTPTPTLVFDEVDAGVGGRAALEVGRRLARLAVDRQVVVVTHLAQVAAFADQHIVVDKPVATGEVDEGVVASDVHTVTGQQRLAELARMLGGSDSATARRHAAELLADARRTATPR